MRNQKGVLLRSDRRDRGGASRSRRLPLWAPRGLAAGRGQDLGPARIASPSGACWPRLLQRSEERPRCLAWFQRGTRPIGTRTSAPISGLWAVYLFGTVCPERDAAFGLVLPIVGADVMQPFLDQLSGEVSPTSTPSCYG